MPESDKSAGNFPLSLRWQRDTLREDVDERPQRRDELRRGGRGGGVAGLQRQQHCERVLRAVLLVEGARRACDRRLPRKGLRAQRGAGDRWGGGGLGWRGGSQSGGAQSGRSAGAARACVRRACPRVGADISTRPCAALTCNVRGPPILRVRRTLGSELSCHSKEVGREVHLQGAAHRAAHGPPRTARVSVRRATRRAVRRRAHERASCGCGRGRGGGRGGGLPRIEAEVGIEVEVEFKGGELDHR